MPEPNRSGNFFILGGNMKDTRLLQIFQNVKDTICKYDYYIHTSQKIIHLSNTEDKIPHLMGLQYAGRPKQYTGDFGAYAVKREESCIYMI